MPFSLFPTPFSSLLTAVCGLRTAFINDYNYNHTYYPLLPNPRPRGL